MDVPLFNLGALEIAFAVFLGVMAWMVLALAAGYCLSRRPWRVEDDEDYEVDLTGWRRP